MRSKMIFGYPLWTLAAILRKQKLHIDLKWREMRSKVIFDILDQYATFIYIECKSLIISQKLLSPKWPPGVIL